MKVINELKKIKKYPFFLLMILTSILFGIFLAGKQVFPVFSDTNYHYEKMETTKKTAEKIDWKIDEQEKFFIEDTQENMIPFMERIKTLETVEDNYLDGALFIGDSRTTILHDYGGWTATDFFVKNGLSVWTALDTPLDTVNGTKEYLVQLLEEKSYSKIYIMLGVNELGEGNPQSFAQQYQLILTTIAEKQPYALIFLQEIIHVTPEQDGKRSYINNTEINLRNEELKKITNGKNIIYLPINEAFDLQGSGMLNPVFSGDGIHVQAKNLEIWKRYLLDHGVKIQQ